VLDYKLIKVISILSYAKLYHIALYSILSFRTKVKEFQQYV